MEDYRRPLNTARGEGESAARETVDEAAAFLQRLIPLPGAEVPSSFSVLSRSAQGGPAPSDSIRAATDLAAEQAASIVAQAASVLDEEMARGVLAARRSPGAARSSGQSDASNPLLRQVHEVVDNLAAVWPNLQGAPHRRYGGSRPAATDADGLAELKPPATVKPGQRATISMTVCNKESRAVRLVPAATDLIGSRGGRIPSSLLELMPSAVRLEAGEQRDVTISTTVPLEAVPGCYSGLLVVSGVDDLRALITIEVE